MWFPKRLHVPPPAGFGPLPFSSGVLVGDTFYLGGHLGYDPATKKVPSELEEEIHFLLDAVRNTLAQADLTMDDLVLVQVFCPDISLYERFNALYVTYFQKELPARSFVGSGPILLGAHFEMLGIAVRP